MQKILNLFRNTNDILMLDPSEVGDLILPEIRNKECLNNFSSAVRLTADREGINFNHTAVLNVIAEGWQWLVNEGMLAGVPDSGVSSGWMFVTRKGEQYATQGIKQYLQSNVVPWAIIHKKIFAKSKPDFLRGEYDSAVLKAYKELEHAAREQAQISREVHGAKVFDQFFSPNAIKALPAEYDEKDRGQLINLFKSSYDLYRNPRGHRNIDDHPQEAAEMIILASHLMKIIDDCVENAVWNKKKSA